MAIQLIDNVVDEEGELKPGISLGYKDGQFLAGSKTRLKSLSATPAADAVASINSALRTAVQNLTTVAAG